MDVNGLAVSIELFLGTDVGAYVSMNRGQRWQRFMTGLPTVPVHDLQIHPREHELIAGTHGRAIYVVDIAPLQQMTATVIAKKAHLFTPKIALALGQSPDAAGSAGGGNGHKRFAVNSAPSGAELAYRIAEVQPGARPQITITDAAGDTMRTLNGPGGVGVHRVMWDMRGKRPATAPLSPAERRDSVKTYVMTMKVLDSLQTSGMDSNMVRTVRTAVQQGRTTELLTQFAGGGGGFGGAGQQTGIPAWVDRPGEGALAGARGAGGRGGAPGAAAGGAPGASAMQDIFAAFRGVPGSLFGRGGRGGGGAPMVKTGEYLVTFTYGDVTQKQVLRVERDAALTGASGFGVEDENDGLEADGRSR